MNLLDFFDNYDQSSKDIRHKNCIYCNISKPATTRYFNKKKGKCDGLDNRCKVCQHERTKEVTEIKKKYTCDVTVCERCGEDPSARRGLKKKPLHADHDPETKQFRGWLCERCNLGLGILGDTEKDLLQSYEYIRDRRNGRPVQTNNTLYTTDKTKHTRRRKGL